MRKKRELMDVFGEKLDIPRELLPGGFALSLSGREELTVRGCRRILAYSEERIVLLLGKTALAIQGRRLLCSAFEAGAVVVKGSIDTLSFEKEGMV